MTANGEYQFDVQEVEYLKHGGVLPYVLRQLLSA